MDKYRASKQLPSELVDHPLPIEKVLYETVEPLIYLTKNRNGDAMLAYVADSAITLLTPITGEQIEALESCRLPVRDALTQSWMWLYHEYSGSLFEILLEGIPDDCLPVPGVMIYPK